MSVSKENIHANFHRWFLKGVSTAQGAGKINNFYGDQCGTRRNARKWFKMFRDGRQKSARKRGSGRPVTVDKSKLRRKLKRNQSFSTRDLADGLCSQSTA